MHAMRVQIRMLFRSFCQDAFAFTENQRLVGFVFQAQYLLPLVFIADPAFESAIRACPGIEQGLSET